MEVLTGIGPYLFPAVLLAVPIYAYRRGVPVYETFLKGAGEGLRLAAETLPYLVAVFAAVSCVRGSGALDYLSSALAWLLKPLGIPADVVPLIVIRPVSGSAALAVTGEILRAHGPDSPVGILASILQGATDTTFFVVTIYFSRVKTRNSRRALLACLVGDAFGFLAGYILWRAMAG